jgi:hypothetical protein
MKKGRSESAALIGVDRGYATFRELHFFLEYCEDDFQALLTSTRQVAPSVSRARNPSSQVFCEIGGFVTNKAASPEIR